MSLARRVQVLPGKSLALVGASGSGKYAPSQCHAILAWAVLLLHTSFPIDCPCGETLHVPGMQVICHLAHHALL